MTFANIQKAIAKEQSGSVATIVAELIVGVVVLFVGLFALSSVEPIFSLDECVYTNYSGTPALPLNASLTAGATKNMTFAATTIKTTCDLYANVSNQSTNAAGRVTVRSGSGLLLGTITPSATSIMTKVVAIPTNSTGNLVLNFTHISGIDNVTVEATTTYVSCCTSEVRKSTVAGKYFDPMVQTAAAAFSVFGLIIIVIALATAIGSLKSMTSD
jgi:hypothetical protein